MPKKFEILVQKFNSSVCSIHKPLKHIITKLSILATRCHAKMCMVTLRNAHDVSWCYMYSSEGYKTWIPDF